VSKHPCPACGGPPVPRGVVPLWDTRACPGGIALLRDGLVIDHLGAHEVAKLASGMVLNAIHSGLFLLDGFAGDEIPEEVSAA
jgi:hypothetical protein